MREPDLWENKWKRFLYEGMTPQTINGEELNKIFGFFHVSEQKLSHDDYFEFTPRLPRHPYSDFHGNVTEDNFTRRVSVAPTIELALKSIEGQGDDEDWAHLYAGFGQADTEAKQKDCPEDFQQEYNTLFYLSTWLKNKLLDGDLSVDEAIRLGMQIPPELRTDGRGKGVYDPEHIPKGLNPRLLPARLRDEFKQCVPDADETKEQWLTRPTEMIYVGELHLLDAQVLLSARALQLVRKAGLQTDEY